MKIKTKNLILSVVMSLIILCGASSGVTVKATGEYNNFTQFGSTYDNIPIYKCWKITFNQPVNPDTIKDIWNMDGQAESVPVTFTLSPNHKVLYVQNTKPYEWGRQYTLYLMNIKNDRGVKMKAILIRFNIEKAE